jgi:hypothetical protein
MNRIILFSGIIAAIAPLQGQNYVSLSGAFASNPASQVLEEGFGNQVVKGKPFSATEERHSLQVLGDGTRIETSQTNRLYRDSEGRTRVEEMNGTIAIYDPVAKLKVELDPATKTARKTNTLLLYNANSGNTLTFSGYGSRVLLGPNLTGPNAIGQNPPVNPAALTGVMAETTENLPAQTVNGVTAQGIRTTMTIPKGQIGNNRDIKVMTERWFSNDLQMLVKSTNSDPRFGDTAYQLTKVVQSAPDPALFQIPADYTLTEQQRFSLKRE